MKKMKKYRCKKCKWVYDPEFGDIKGAFPQIRHSRICRPTGFARFAKHQKSSSRRWGKNAITQSNGFAFIPSPGVP